MGKRKKKRRLKKLLKACDPETSVLSLLIVQAWAGRFPFFGGEIRKFYAESPDKLIAQAELPSHIETAWKKGKWKAVAKYLETESSAAEKPPTEVPTNRGWPP